MTVAERVEAALHRPPLCEIGAAARAELDEVVAGADSFDDLPGKWQAAVLRAEGHCGADEPRGCCASHGL